ncbi:hypothetical protein ABZ725_29975 [Streptomyces sp. NPDC006872]|uniref:hypothetical protein n=1 Tax=Streptomyces sp. NPDC006872 TaxID=3155720 RepID=UPI0033D4B6DE
MRRWQKVLLAVDRRLGTGELPTRLELTVARHPVRTGVVCGIVLAVAFIWALSGFDDPGVLFQAALFGAGMGLFLWGAARLTRWQQAYDARTGRYEEARQAAAWKRAEPLSPGAVALRLLGVWVVMSGALWAIGSLDDPPWGLLWSAVFGALIVVVSFTAAWLKQKRSR